MKNIKQTISILLCLLLFSGCSQESRETESGTFESKSEQITEVKVIIAQTTSFQHEIISNGRISAVRKADLNFMVNQPILKINYQNGDRIGKGDTIAVLENFELESRLTQSKIACSMAKLDFIDALIGLGYELKDSATIPEKTWETAMLRSGYGQAKSALLLADYYYNASILTAPMSGIVSNMFSKELNLPEPNTQFCTVIDNRIFQVEFPILETEITKVKKHQKVEISPFFNTSLKIEGKITVINPVVEENGMIRVYAEVNNQNNILFQGMNVKVAIKQKLDNQITVPKEAVTNRSDRDVIFTVSDGEALWNYAIIEDENDDYYLIAEGISPGDSVIINGNAHLANLSKVRVVN